MKTTPDNITELKDQAKGFYCSDGSEETEQWVLKLTHTKFVVYERHADCMQEIDLNDYTDQEIRDFVSGYYNSLEELYAMYGPGSNGVIAEIISEQTILDTITWDALNQKLVP